MHNLLGFLTYIFSMTVIASTDVHVELTDEIIKNQGIYFIDSGVDENGLRNINIGYCKKYIDKNNIIRIAKAMILEVKNQNKIVLQATLAPLSNQFETHAFSQYQYQAINEVNVSISYGEAHRAFADRAITIDFSKIPEIGKNKNLKSDISFITTHCI